MSNEDHRFALELELIRLQAILETTEANITFWRTFLIAIIVQTVALFIFVWLLG